MIFFILLDTNVILDFAMRRGEHYVFARRIMKEIANGRLIAHISASQITDIYYFLEKNFSHEEAIRMIADLIESIRVIGVDKQTIRKALASPMSDFEDAVQAVAAKEFDLDIVVTRDGKGFRDSGLRVYSPQEFLKALE